MKYVLILYHIINGTPVEQGRVDKEPMAIEQCRFMANMVGASILNNQPELAGKIKVDCVPA